ncbi:MAG: type IV secretory system conjugative DNA transfer family protein [Planctomycetota bacterium]|jgi:type IV secretion system protein VirD4|nr:type IV secretory system conjugative DNA transfer family protein [Planctomycetota bacterium]
MADDKITVGYKGEEKRKPWVRIILAALGFFLGMATATQVLARLFGYADLLGFNIHGVYFPGMYLIWYWELGDLYPVEFRIALSCGAIVAGGLMLAGLVIDNMLSKSAQGSSRFHGTAHWASPEEVERCGLLGNADGVYVGGWMDEEGQLHYLRDSGPSHVLCFAPTRGGKGVGLVLPTLLSWKHSAIVSDLKGELWQLTSGWRKEHANNMVLRFEPASPEECARWNPLDEVRLGTSHESADIGNIANTLIDPSGKGVMELDFWGRSAGNLLKAVITHVLYKREREGTPANLQAVAYFLADPKNPDMKLEDKFTEMLEYPHYADGTSNLEVSSMGRAMLNKPENERGSVISTMDSVLGLYKDPVVAMNTERSDFRIIDIMNAENPISLYLITTPDNKDRLCPLLRLLIDMILKRLAANVGYEGGRTVMAHKRRLLMMLDEFPSFGKLDAIANSLAFVAGYGIKIYMISQDTIQFDAVYSEKNSVISNCHIQVIFPPNRLETAKYVSEMLGETTVVERQYSVSGKRAGMLGEQVTETVQMNKRPLLTPDEVMAMPGPKKNAVGDIEEPGEMIVRVAGAAPIRGRQPLYFLDDTFLARAKVPAPAKSDRFGFEMEGKTEAKVAEMKEEEEEVEIGEGLGGAGKDEGENSNGAEPKQRDRPEPERSVEVEDSVKPEQSGRVPGVFVENVKGEAEQRDQPETERGVGVEGGHEIAR